MNTNALRGPWRPAHTRWVSKVRRIPRDLTNLYRYTDTETFLRYVTQVILHLPGIMWTGSYACADRAMRGRRVRFRPEGKAHPALVWDGSYFGIAREVCCRRVYFALPGFQIQPGDCVVDLGAHVGSFTVPAALLGARVLAVEAQAANIQVLRSMLEWNGCARKVTVEWGLVGGGSGLLSTEETRRTLAGDAPSLTLSRLMAQHGIRHIDFLKIDIEGSEFDLFASEPDWLPHVQCIAMEIHSKCGCPAQIVSQLSDAGFVVTRLDQDQNPIRRGNQGDSYILAMRGHRAQITGPNVSVVSDDTREPGVG